MAPTLKSAPSASLRPSERKPLAERELDRPVLHQGETLNVPPRVTQAAHGRST